MFIADKTISHKNLFKFENREDGKFIFSDEGVTSVVRQIFRITHPYGIRWIGEPAFKKEFSFFIPVKVKTPNYRIPEIHQFTDSLGSLNKGFRTSYLLNSFLNASLLPRFQTYRSLYKRLR